MTTCSIPVSCTLKDKIIALQVALIDRQTLQKALFAWKTWHAGKRDRRAKLRKAVNRILRGCLSRAFFQWRDNIAAEEKSRMQRRKVLTFHLTAFLGTTSKLCYLMLYSSP
jgi:hypothetical protein